MSEEIEEVSIFVLSGLKSRLKTSWYIVIARSPANPIPYQNKGIENDILARKTSHSATTRPPPNGPHATQRRQSGSAAKGAQMTQMHMQICVS